MILKASCNKCHERKPLTKQYFHVDNSRTRGFSYTCRKCRVVQNHGEKRRRYVKESQKKYRTNNRVKHRAREKSIKALRDGLLTKKPCAVCDGKKSEMHHINYDNPLAVIWLCRGHHAELHANINQMGHYEK